MVGAWEPSIQTSRSVPLMVRKAGRRSTKRTSGRCRDFNFGRGRGFREAASWNLIGVRVSCLELGGCAWVGTMLTVSQS